MTDKFTSNICRSAITLMRDLSVCYGTDRGLEFFNKLCETLGDDIKHQIFLGMLGAPYTDHSVRVVSGGGNVGSAATEISKYAQVSFFEAKAQIEQVKKHGHMKTFYCKDATAVDNLKKSLKDIGYFCD